MIYHLDHNWFTIILFPICFWIIYGRYHKSMKAMYRAKDKLYQLEKAKEKQDNGFTIYENELSALSDKEFYEFTKQKRTKESKTRSHIVFAITYAIVLYIFH